ncbi:CE1759 family FMN reductase [Nonomuraea endophytica]|uniref:FMN reductase n=1 Tax=Nonomuraea endophytica TaxID=714136 RepID=A0A7W8EFQ9_9ACTN|nr:CE1759 family FMN reductase [Nonomuraea endophytica]MBB5077829.1 FMN reductase [Nonomuraea endophytica]
MKLVAVSAGLTQPSSTRLLTDRLVEATVRAVGDEVNVEEVNVGEVNVEEVEVEVVELRDLATDIANNFVTGFAGRALRAAQEAVTSADGLIAVTPIFTASYSGLFKSFFDVLDPESLEAKPTLIAATGGTPRHSLALEHALRPMFAYLHAVVAPTAVYAAAEDWGNDDGLPDRVRRAATELAGLMRHRAPAREERLVPFAEQLAALTREP